MNVWPYSDFHKDSLPTHPELDSSQQAIALACELNPWTPRFLFVSFPI